MKPASVLLLLAVVLPAAFAWAGILSTGASMAMKGAQLTHRVTGAVLDKTASMTSGVPMVGGAIGSMNTFYHDASTVRGAVRIAGRSIASTINFIGRSNIVKLIKMFGDLVMMAMDMAKGILLQRLSSIPIVGSSLTNADDVMNMMMKYGQAAGLPTAPIEAAYAAFLLLVNGLFSAIM